MPELPTDWLGWLTLIGSIAGIATAVKVFFAGFWLNKFQRRAIVAASYSCTKRIIILRVFGGGVIFHLEPTDDNGSSPNPLHRSLGSKEGSVGQSNADLAYLNELTDKNLFAYVEQEIKNMNSKDEQYHLTAKGLRYARVLRFFVRPKG